MLRAINLLFNFVLLSITWENEWYQDRGRSNALSAAVFKGNCDSLTVSSDMTPLLIFIK